MNEINDKKHISLHVQIRNEILGDILNGVLKPGDKLPSENELSKEFNVSRTTVRLALTHLSQKGLIISKPGKGSYVTPSVMGDLKMNVIGFLDSPENNSKIKSFEVIETKNKYDSMTKICSILQIPLGEKIISLFSIKVINNELIGVDQSYLPYRYASEILQHDLEGKFIDEIMTSIGKTPHKVEQMIKACFPDRDSFNLLNLKDVIPLICIERISYLVGDIPIEYCKSYFKGDRYRLNIIMEENK